VTVSSLVRVGVIFCFVLLSNPRQTQKDKIKQTENEPMLYELFGARKQIYGSIRTRTKISIACPNKCMSSF